MEVIDPRAGVVLATFRLDGPDVELPPFSGLAPGTRLGYRTVEDELGFESIEVDRIHLVAKEAGRGR